MGRKIRNSDEIREIEKFLIRSLIMLDAHGLKMTSIYVDMALNTLAQEHAAINFSKPEMPVGSPSASVLRDRL